MQTALMVLAVVVVATQGAEIKWTGIVNDQQWTTANNWYPAKVPGPGDAVTIDDAEGKDAVVVMTTPATIASLNMGSLVTNKAKLRVLNRLTVTSGVTVQVNGELEINSGEAALVAQNVEAEVAGTLSFMAGTLAGSYKVTGKANFAGLGAKVFYHTAMTVDSKQSMVASGSLQFNASTIASNTPVEAAGFNFQLMALDKTTGSSFKSSGLSWAQ